MNCRCECERCRESIHGCGREVCNDGRYITYSNRRWRIIQGDRCVESYETHAKALAGFRSYQRQEAS